MNTIVFVRRFLADYARNPVNLLMLVVVPAVFVVAAAGYLVDAARLLSDAPAEASSVATATAGWAAAFLAGIAMYFQVSAARRCRQKLRRPSLRCYRNRMSCKCRKPRRNRSYSDVTSSN